MTSRTMPVATAGANAAFAVTRSRTRVRLAFIDNLRILLVVLVVVHHLAVTYGGDGSWHYYDGRADSITTMVLTLFVAVNQAFFIGVYFVIAAYFVPPISGTQANLAVFEGPVSEPGGAFGLPTPDRGTTAQLWIGDHGLRLQRISLVLRWPVLVEL